MMTLTTERPTIYVRDNNTPTVSRRGLSRSFIGRVFSYVAQATGLVALAVIAYFWLVVLHVLLTPVEGPETRCFTNAIGETYCRSQREWEAE